MQPFCQNSVALHRNQKLSNKYFGSLQNCAKNWYISLSFGSATRSKDTCIFAQEENQAKFIPSSELSDVVEQETALPHSFPEFGPPHPWKPDKHLLVQRSDYEAHWKNLSDLQILGVNCQGSSPPWRTHLFPPIGFRRNPKNWRGRSNGEIGKRKDWIFFRQ